ncbi:MULTISPECIES: hypothetical protein [Vibrio]|uniref:hypothetical protein n=2 Tax=Vibrionaceae TaxID=641 RepID=UPI001482A2BB|nr:MULTISPECIES: hypothetical protein [Vibrio]EJA7360948.1 hypothetical protein [Vibrio alginolyticus]MCA2450191.1 hypothetical protein [Vibrio alginolyticus]MCA2473679.1 hypothetical protein [Vibrio alginolyticus]MDW1797010.1 hypothetical protein [Vibrio sp. Vb2297]MDW2153706.1 hypothetical protein [Vibrio sp. 2092]
MNLDKLKDYVDSVPFIRDVIRKVYSLLFNEVLSKKKKARMAEHFDELVFEISSDSKVLMWPAFGTLLGIYRDNGIIAHDNDIDFAAWYEDRVKVRNYLEEKGCSLVKRFSSETVEYAYEEQYQKDGVQFDVFYFIKDEGSVYTHDFMRHQNLTRVQTKELLGGLIVRRLYVHLSSIGTYCYKGVNIHFPENVEEHLGQRYGEDFMTPNPNWVAQEENPYVEELTTDGQLQKF